MLDGFIQLNSPPIHARREVCQPDFSAQITALDAILKTDKRFARIRDKQISVYAGDLVGVRPNLNSPKDALVPVQTIHKGGKSAKHRDGRGFWNGEVLRYAAFVVLRIAYFNVRREARERIASGDSSKFPMASVDGEFADVQEFDATGLEIRFNPKHHRHFVDLAGCYVSSAEEVTVFGNRVFARGKIEYIIAQQIF